MRCIIRRTRDYLENNINKETGEPYLKKINVLLLGEKESEALELSGYMKRVAESDSERDHIHLDDLTIVSEESDIKNLIIEKEE